MRSIYIFFSILLLNQIPVLAQHRLSGRVTDMGGHPLPAATVYIPELQVGTISSQEWIISTYAASS